MRRLINKFGDLRFRDKLTFSTLIAALIPLLLFSMVVGTTIIGEVGNKSSQLTLQVVTQTSESLDIYIGTIEKLMNYVIDECSEESTATDNNLQYLSEMTASILDAYPEIAGITIAYPDDSYYGEGMTRISKDLFADEGWYQYALELHGKLGIVGNAIGRNVVNNLNDSSDSIFSLVKSFEIEKDCYGVVLFDIRHDIIEQLIDRVSIGEEGLLYVVDDNDMVYTPESDVVYRIDKTCYQNDSKKGDMIKINGKDFFVISHHSDYSGWRTIGVLPRTEFLAGVQSIYHTLAICIIISLVLVVLVSVGISSTVTRPLLRLASFMEKVEDGDFSVRFKSKYRDEIGTLGKSFNHMIERINQLINELYVEKQNRLEAQLKTLQEQIKPHFLYNTLDTISWMARSHDANDVVQLVDALTNMFRVGLSSGRDYIALREEKKHVINYLYIQKVRYGERLQYDIDIPEEYDAVIVPKLILQPLVENAIYHGVKMKRVKGSIVIRAEAKGDKLYLHVKDDGAGMSLERLEEIRGWLENPQSRNENIGFGLSYIEERIVLTYGLDYGISVESREGEFTEVTICLPL